MRVVRQQLRGWLLCFCNREPVNGVDSGCQWLYPAHTVVLITFGLSWSAAIEQRRSCIVLNDHMMLQQTNTRDSA
jgi:hypothetical protein